MGLVDQHTGFPVILANEAVEKSALIEKAIDVCHGHITPARHLMTQKIRANVVSGGDIRQDVLSQQSTIVSGGFPGLRQSVEKSRRQGAGFTMAGLIGMLTGMLLGHQLQYSQGQRVLLVFIQCLDALKRHSTGGVTRRQVKEPVLVGPRHGHQGGIEGAQGFAETCGGFKHQGVMADTVSVHGFSQSPLPTAKAFVRELQATQGLIARLPVSFFIAPPGKEALT